MGILEMIHPSKLGPAIRAEVPVTTQLSRPGSLKQWPDWERIRPIYPR